MKTVIIGGAGFIGVNLAEHFLKKGYSVTVFDNLSRRGTKENMSWLQKNFPKVQFVSGDIRKDVSLLSETMQGADAAYHLAGQVAVTTSVKDPREDFDINALGSFNVLEAARSLRNPPVLFYSSTNKVYGGMEEIKIVDRGDKYDYQDLPQGISEQQSIDFHSPYGCSKGTADQYFRDYARIYGLKTVVFRQSCIYGERQFGIEDQGWLAWFTIASMLNQPITIYGDGKQIRDVLYVGDLVRAFDLATEKINVTAGKIYNVGGGRRFTLSLLELLTLLENFHGREIPVAYSDWRPGDQKDYISDPAKAKNEFGWEPLVSPQQGMEKLAGWVRQNVELVQSILGFKQPVS